MLSVTLYFLVYLYFGGSFPTYYNLFVWDKIAFQRLLVEICNHQLESINLRK